MTSPKVKLNDGNDIPIVGLGTYASPKGEVYRAVIDAIECGYRHFDCADVYKNQQEIGNALKDAIAANKVTRDELFVVTKVWCTYFGKGRVIKSTKRMLSEYGFEYFDLLLLHWPTPLKDDDSEFLPTDDNDNLIPNDVDIVDVYKELEDVKRKGLTKSIGISNFNTNQIERVLQRAEFIPVTNQVECHPYFNQSKLFEFCRNRNITLTAYCPLARPGTKPDEPNLLEDAIIKKLAQKYGKTEGQIVIKWHTQRGIIVIPKSVTKERIKANIDIFDFTLNDDDMKMIESLNRDHRLVKFDMKGMINNKEYPFSIPF